MTQTNPEQWAVELWRDICTAIVCSKPYDKDTAAVNAIQAAFAEREAQLVEALERIAGRPCEGIEYIPGHGDEPCSEARHMELIALAALKDRTHG